MGVGDRLRACLAAADAWCVGRLWQPRALVLAFLAWTLARQFADDGYVSWFRGLDTGVHEGGHLLFGFFGRAACVAGGTIAQCAAPIIAGGVFARQRDWFAIAFAGTWLSVNLLEVAVYCADASAMALTLMTVGHGSDGAAREDVHDWHVMLDAVGMLGAETWLAPLIRLVAMAIGIASLAFGARLCGRMARAAPAQP